MRPNYLLLLLVATLVVCCQGLPEAADNTPIESLKAETNRGVSITTHRSLRGGKLGKIVDVPADEEEEERGLALGAKLKELAKTFPTLDKFKTLMRKNPDPKKLESMVKTDPQLSKFKSTVEKSGLKITARDVQRVQSIAAKNPSAAKRSKTLIVFLLSCVVLGATGSTQAMQMQQVRVPRAPQVPVPPVSASPLELSRETRQQLRATRHRAFERHQENAQWTQQLLDGSEAAFDAAATPSGLPASPEELEKKVEAQKNAADALERELKLQKETQEAEQRRFEEMLAALKAAGDAEAVKLCEEKLEAEKTRLVTAKPRKMEIVRL